MRPIDDFLKKVKIQNTTYQGLQEGK